MRLRVRPRWGAYEQERGDSTRPPQKVFYTRVAECIRNAFRPRRSKEIVGPSPTSGTILMHQGSGCPKHPVSLFREGEMKLCSLCSSEGTFRKRPNGNEYLHCDKCQNAITARHYRNNKERYLKRNRLRREEVKKQCVEYLRAHPCVDCGEPDPVVLDF